MEEEYYILKKITQITSTLRILPKIAKLHLNALKHSRELNLVQNNLSKIKPHDIILFSVMKNEAHRLEYFIQYYRSLGVNHFIFVDNDSTDMFYEIMAGRGDVSVFYTKASYKESNFGMHWLNYLLRKYGSNHWCVTCDPDEFLVYPKLETRNLRDLTEFLSSRRQASLFTPMIDMYSQLPLDDVFCQSGQNPLDVCRFFDGAGYVKRYQKGYRNIWCQGGVRRRVFYPDNPSSSPAINKYSLIQWKWYYAYVQSMHMVVPRRLNEIIGPHYTSGALLHFKFISAFKHKVEEELESRQHFNNSAEYIQYSKLSTQDTGFFDERISIEYEGWRTLAELGLINRGEW